MADLPARIGDRERELAAGETDLGGAVARGRTLVRRDDCGMAREPRALPR